MSVSEGLDGRRAGWLPVRGYEAGPDGHLVRLILDHRLWLLPGSQKACWANQSPQNGLGSLSKRETPFLVPRNILFAPLLFIGHTKDRQIAEWLCLALS